MLGRTISHYQIVEKLGEGGMGVVYKARDTRLNRFAAIKVLSPGKTTSEDRRRRFAQEAQAASALNHPNIITIYDIVEEDATVVAQARGKGDSPAAASRKKAPSVKRARKNGATHSTTSKGDRPHAAH
jgi:serine/threonine protein kinase